MSLRRVSALVLVAAAGTLVTAAPAAVAGCQVQTSPASVCAGADTDRRCVYANGHVDVYKYRIACSPS